MEIDTELNAAADRIYKLAGDMIADGQKPFAIAAIFTMVALQIYKTSLTKEDYDMMVDSISDSRDKVQTLPELVKDPFMKSFH